MVGKNMKNVMVFPEGIWRLFLKEKLVRRNSFEHLNDIMRKVGDQ